MFIVNGQKRSGEHCYDLLLSLHLLGNEIHGNSMFAFTLGFVWQIDFAPSIINNIKWTADRDDTILDPILFNDFSSLMLKCIIILHHFQIVPICHGANKFFDKTLTLLTYTILTITVLCRTESILRKSPEPLYYF